MSIKNIRIALKEAGIKASVKYLKENEKGRQDFTCMYEITFPKIADEDYWDEPIEVIDYFDATCRIEEYIADYNIYVVEITDN